MKKFFIGSSIATVDEHGTILLPPAFLATMRERYVDGNLFIGRHEDGQRLMIYDQMFFTEHDQAADLGRRVLVDGNREQNDRLLRRTFTFVEQIRLTDVNRMSIGPIMRERGQIGAAVLLVGVGHCFEVWDLDSVIERGPYDLSWVAQRHLRARQMADQADASRQLNLLLGPAPVAASRKRPSAPLRTARMPVAPLVSVPTSGRGVVRSKAG